MMDISDNMLSAFMCGVSTPDEDLRILNEMMYNEEFSDMMDVFHEVNDIDNLEEMMNELNENADCMNDFKDYNINIK